MLPVLSPEGEQARFGLEARAAEPQPLRHLEKPRDAIRRRRQLGLDALVKQSDAVLAGGSAGGSGGGSAGGGWVRACRMRTWGFEMATPVAATTATVCFLANKILPNIFEIF